MHSGHTTYAGHYTAQLMSARYVIGVNICHLAQLMILSSTRQWYHFDDEVVKPVDENRLGQAEAKPSKKHIEQGYVVAFFPLGFRQQTMWRI